MAKPKKLNYLSQQGVSHISLFRIHGQIDKCPSDNYWHTNCDKYSPIISNETKLLLYLKSF